MRATTAMFTRHGGPDVIAWQDVTLPAPGPGEVLMRNVAVGLNFIDTYYRSGLYPVALPCGLGSEASGVVEAVGPDVTDFVPGDRVATFGPTLGAYATARIVPARELFRLPDGIAHETAAAVMLKGCTTEFLAERAARAAPGDWVLVHAAAGGVGQLLVQWLTAIGARVIATVGSAPKAEIARACGAQVVVLADAPDAVEQIRAATGGTGVAISYDGVGASSWPISLGAMARRGTIVSFGNASGPVTGVALTQLAGAGSLFVTRPRLFDYYVTPEERAAGIARLWDMLLTGKLRVTIGQTWPLAQAAAAHTALEARATTGSTLLRV
ncbi:zinc-binding dehydrogenase [Novosphingobium sp. FSY-8]|uniref:Zinc-binding dehydrogenase n=1 Tax=Novosphingobium ovatum TaxID=1908523 RepID=A0ABW9XBH5_9SPHN|nr:quinone oxidoreductase [Novosphingobium ovatum]NBC35874.1 zinc-binding dehydrogenase [Novosphingobium ovatum]